MTKEAKWVIEWFERRGPVPANTLEEQLGLNYFEADLVDSFGVIELIADVESQFGISFNERHFQDRDFSTIGGLSRLVAQLLKVVNPAGSANG